MSKLFIVNYGVDMTQDNLPDAIKREDERLMARGREIISAHNMGKGAIMVSEVLHAEVPTLNNWRYMEKGLADAVPSFYKNGFTPFLMHHDDGVDTPISAPLAIGSNIYGEYIKRDVDHPMGKAKGYVKVVTFVPDSAMVKGERAIDLMQARRISALSAGSQVSMDNRFCSICGKNIHSEECTHSVGRIYDGRKAVIDMYNPRFNEYSAVYSPGDIIAQIRRVDITDSTRGTPEETIVDVNLSPIHASFYDSSKIFTSASIQQESSMDIKDFLKLESSEKLAEALTLMHTELKNRDSIIGSLSDLVIDLKKTKVNDASAAVGETEPATVPASAAAGETSEAEIPTPETSTAPDSDAELAALKIENEQLKAKLAEKTPAEPEKPADASADPGASEPASDDQAQPEKPGESASTEQTDTTDTSADASETVTDVKKTVSFRALLKGMKPHDVKADAASVSLSKFL